MMTMIPILKTSLGRLYETDCMELLQTLDPESVDLAFADPPFNLGKTYSSKINDQRTDGEYLNWCQSWLDGMVQALKPGGALFMWNLPKWNIPLGSHLSRYLTFRHWIAVDIKYTLPIANRLYPSHYSLLYYIKGDKPAIFHPDRLPIVCCRHCSRELRDYGGYKSKMNPKGVNISDVWTDIPPVRHAKYKKREANSLSLKLMDRIVSMASDPGSLILDPFGGSGTTYIAAELTGRRWIGSELDCATIIKRFERMDEDSTHLADIRKNKNILFKREDINRRKRAGTPLSRDYRIDSGESLCECTDEQMPEQSSLFASP